MRIKLFKTALILSILTMPIAATAQESLDDTLSIDELVFVGFAQQKKVNLTGAVSQVNMEEVIGDRPLTSIGAALQGAIPGLSISGNSAPGQFKSLNIRGQLSINGGPLLSLSTILKETSTPSTLRISRVFPSLKMPHLQQFTERVRQVESSS